jgi:hypothetical protein
MPIDFGAVLKTLESGIINLAETDVKDFVAQATADGQAIIAEMKDDLQTWTKQFADGELSEGDLQDLILGQKGEIEMIALKDAGIAEIEADKFKADVLNLITSTITALI